MLERFDGVRFILGHAGGFLPYISYRVMLAMAQRASPLVRAATVAAPDRMVPRHLSVLRRFYYDTALSSTPAALPSLLEIADSTRILHGTDFPFAPPAAVRLMNRYYERAPLSEPIRRSIDHQAAAQLFPRLAGRFQGLENNHAQRSAS
ncbi:amidohydrolase family protein [Agromyces laixinhei]|uniref:amidohydrolase family protein n=1 Tax=Agromyces laixinhei TaxID=2585717 RepID=UPI0018DD87B9|nr:amidohydrolase family protein [Agromyces laixinhei]